MAPPPPPANPATQPKPAGNTTSSSETFKLLLFASASTYCGSQESLTLQAPMTLPSLIDELESKFPGVGTKVLKSCQLVLNLEYVDVDLWEVVEGKVVDDGGGNGGGDGKGIGKKRVGEDVVFKKGDEVALVPPVSSG